MLIYHKFLKITFQQYVVFLINLLHATIKKVTDSKDLFNDEN